MDLPSELRAKGRSLKTVDQALRYIDTELPAELQALPRWKFARDLLLAVQQTSKSRDLNAAYRQLKQALGNDRLTK